MASFSRMGTGLEEGLGCNGDTHSLPLAESSLTSLLPHKLRGKDQPGRAGGSQRHAAPTGRGHHPRGGRGQAGWQQPMGIILVHTPCCWGRSHAAPASSRPEQLHELAAEQDVENIKEGNEIKQKEASPPAPPPPSHPRNSPGQHPTPGTVRLETSPSQAALPAPYLSL